MAVIFWGCMRKSLCTWVSMAGSYGWLVWLPALLLSGCIRPKLTTPLQVTPAGIASRTGLPVIPEGAVRGQSRFPPGIDLDRPLSGDDAAAIALWNNPQLQVDLAALGLAHGDLIDAGLLRNPQLNLLFPVGLKPFELLLNLPMDAFWSRPRRVEASQAAYDQLAQSLIQNGLNAVRDARLAHADLILADSRKKAGERVSALRRRIVELTNARLRAGDISELEAMAARTEAATVEEQLVRLRHDVELASERLRIALGLSTDRTSFEVSAAPANTTRPPSASDLLEKALEARPDLRAAEIAITAAAKRAGWERSRILAVSSSLSSKGIGTNGILTGPGLIVDLPIFNRNQGLIARADADVEAASRQYLNIKQRVAFEVYEARELLVQAQELLAQLQDQVLPQLQQSAKLAEQQYEKGDVAYLFVLEQSRGQVDAELRLADAEAAVRRGMAQLERSVGTKW